jgi:hypothetical protein
MPTKLTLSSDLTNLVSAPTYQDVNVLLGTALTTLQTKSSTTYTLALVDTTFITNLTHASGCAITIPANITLAFPLGSEIAFIRGTSAGVITISLGVGVTCRNSAILADVPQDGVFMLKKLDTNGWIAI